MIAFLVALLLELGAPAKVAPEYAVLIEKEARAFKIPAEVGAALCGHESRWNVHARGAKGEIGLCQLLRGTLATRGFEHLTNRQLERPAIQFHLAFRHLAYLRAVCVRFTIDSPGRWVSPYSGRKCGWSSYSNGIMSELTAAESKVIARHGPVLMTGLVGFTPGPRGRVPSLREWPTLWCSREEWPVSR